MSDLRPKGNSLYALFILRGIREAGERVFYNRFKLRTRGNIYKQAETMMPGRRCCKKFTAILQIIL